MRVGALLAQEVKGVEHPLNNLNRSFQGVEMNYSLIELSTQKLRYYLFHSSIATNSIRLKYVLCWPTMLESTDS